MHPECPSRERSTRSYKCYSATVTKYLAQVKVLNSKLHLRKVQKYCHQKIPIAKKVNMPNYAECIFRNNVY